MILRSNGDTRLSANNILRLSGLKCLTNPANGEYSRACVWIVAPGPLEGLALMSQVGPLRQTVGRLQRRALTEAELDLH